MKIFEITDKNQVVGVLHDIEFNFEQEYQKLNELLTILIRLRTPSRNRRALGNIEDFLNKVDKFLNIMFPDPLDTDLIALQNKAKTMKENILLLKEKLIF